VTERVCDWVTQTEAWTSEGGQGSLAPLDFASPSRKGCFLIFEWEKKNSPVLASPRNIP